MTAVKCRYSTWNERNKKKKKWKCMRVCLKCYGVQTAFRKGSFNRRRIINCPDKSFWGVIWRETFVKFHRRNAVVQATKGVRIVNWNKAAKKILRQNITPVEKIIKRHRKIRNGQKEINNEGKGYVMKNKVGR